MSDEQLPTAKFLARYFGNSVRHLKLVFNGQTNEHTMVVKQWYETLARF